jgi:integrase
MPSDSTRTYRKTSDRPRKPYPEFPLYPHPLGYWSKKINSQILHFGRWGRVVKGKVEPLLYEESWRKALLAYKSRIDDAVAGSIRGTVVSEKPTNAVGHNNIADLCNLFLTSKMRKMQSGELSPRSFSEYRQATDLLVGTFGKQTRIGDLAPADFESLRATMAKRWGPARLSKFIQMVRTILKYATDNELIDRPARLGSGFNKPSKAFMRKHKAASDKKLFTPTDILRVLDALDGKEVSLPSHKPGVFINVKFKPRPVLRAAVLLGINAGLGNSDVAGLQFSHLIRGGEWLDYPRVKTGLPRRVPLWSQTVDAISVAISQRGQPKRTVDSECVFINRGGRRMVQMTERSHQDYISSQFRSVLRQLQMNQRKGLNFYSLRHTFATVALESGDRDACRALMGHAVHDMLSVYDETGPSDARLRAVVDHVRQWLFDTRVGHPDK